MLVVPEEFNRNAKSVHTHATPAETGRQLIAYMCERIGIPDLAGKDLLDHGCGVRFSESFLNLGLPVGSYTGLDVHEPLIDFLSRAVDDPRFAYRHVNVANRLYNPRGKAADPYAGIFGADDSFDIVSMFSVIAHQDPTQAAHTFRFLRRHIRPGGHMFFSAFIHPDDEAPPFKDKGARPGLKASYHLDRLTGLLDDTGWQAVSVVDPLPRDLPIMSSLLCRPV